MIKLESGMFRESSKALAEHSFIGKIIRFLIVFFIIILFESIVPSIIALPKMMQEFDLSGMIDENGKISFNDSMQVAMGICAASDVMITTLYSTIFGTLLSIIYCRVTEVRNFASMGAVKKKFIPHYLAGTFFGILMMSVIILSGKLFGTNTISLNKDIKSVIILLYFSGWIIQGMSEEFIFRGYLMTTIGGKHNKWLAVGISSAAFALAHIANPGISVLAFVNLTLFGVFAALYMIYTGNIWGNCAIHSFWNFMQGNFYGVSVSGTSRTESLFITESKTSVSYLSGGGFGAEGSIFTTAVLLAGTAILYVLINRKEKNSPEINA